MSEPEIPRPDVWRRLRDATPARIALKRAGVAISTDAELAFRLAHAEARDAVLAEFDSDAFQGSLERTGQSVVGVKSAAVDKQTYLLRPDLGRRLGEGCRDAIAAYAGEFDVAFVVADGLSALAVERHGADLIGRLMLQSQEAGWKVAPIVVVERGRVAIGDEIGELLGCRLVVVIIGERPGLTSPDGLGAYLTYAPRFGRNDAERNCVSNIHRSGLGYDEAAFRIAWLIREGLAREITGVALKDESGGRSPRVIANSKPT